jgi:hypothetical protein
MYIQVQDNLVSTQLFDKKFVCDLAACKGACCIEGDSGAPLTIEEIDLLEESIDQIKPFMSAEGIAKVDATGVFYMDQENDAVTSLLENGACAFVYFDEKGITKCAIEQAYHAGETDFQKPISCHLFPIRVKDIQEKTALTFQEWHICAPACSCGDKLDIPVFQFLKTPIQRAFGNSFFEELTVVHRAWQASKK